MMNTPRAMNDLRSTHGTKVSMNRRATFMLAIAGAIGIVTQSGRSRAKSGRTGSGRATLAATPNEARRLRSSKAVLASRFQNLKTVGLQGQVMTIYHRHDTFEVMTADGRGTVFQTTDLRFKIDSSDKGPPLGRPVILSGGMMGDRATVFFASPVEVGTLIKYRS